MTATTTTAKTARRRPAAAKPAAPKVAPTKSRGQASELNNDAAIEATVAAIEAGETVTAIVPTVRATAAYATMLPIIPVVKDRPYEEMLTKAPSTVHENMAAWLEAKTGYKPDLKTVQLVCALRMEFQASPENQEHLNARRLATAQAKADKLKAQEARLAKQLAKLEAEKAKAAAAVAK